MKALRYTLQSLNDINFLRLKSACDKNEKLYYNVSLLKNGFKLRDELVNQWENTNSWAFQRGIINKNGNPLNDCGRMSFLHNIEFQNLYRNVCKHQLSNPILIKTIFNNVNTNYNDEDETITCAENKTLLVSEYFVAADSALSKFYSLQRERKIWWMRFSANASRYCIEPFDFSSNNEVNELICEKSKSITIKAKFTFGLVSMEHITLVPLYELPDLKSQIEGNSKISLLRSVINLDFTTCALILDACETSNNAMMLNPKLAPYQILLASVHRGNKIVDDLVLHLKHVISKNNLRLYDEHIHVNNLSDFEKSIEIFDKLGVPYALVVDEESVKTGLMKLRSRDTTLFETIHISDVPNYILSIFKN